MHASLSLTTTFPPHHSSTSTSNINRLPTSSTTSPASSVSAYASPFNFASYHPFTSTPHRGASPSSIASSTASGSISISISTSKSRSTSPLLLRRRPSKIDLALSAERTRCDADAIERQGLSLMEPRPVDPVLAMDGSIFASLGGVGGARAGESLQSQVQRGSYESQRALVRPRFVMGGIFEVMEGRE